MPKDFYRRCASVLLFRTLPTAGLQVFLVHKPRKNDAWQLPQGGVESDETVAQAALRELQEETGLSAVAKQESDRVYQYDFPPSYRRFRPDAVCGQRVHFVWAELQSPEQPVQVDGREIDDYAWVSPSKLPLYIKRREYREIVEQLIEEFGGSVS